MQMQFGNEVSSMQGFYRRSYLRSFKNNTCYIKICLMIIVAVIKEVKKEISSNARNFFLTNMVESLEQKMRTRGNSPPTRPTARKLQSSLSRSTNFDNA